MKVKNILALITNVLLMALGAFPVVKMIVEATDFDYLSLGTNLTYVTFCLLTLMGLWGVIGSIVSLARNKEHSCPIYFSLRLGVLTLSILNIGLIVYSTLIANTSFVWDLNLITSIIIPVCLLVVVLFLDTTSKKQKFVTTLASLIIPVIYFATIVTLMATKVINIVLPFDFMLIYHENTFYVGNLLITLGFAVAPFVLAIPLWLLSNVVASKLGLEVETEPAAEETVVTEEPVVEEVKEETPVTKEVKETKKTTKKTTKKEEPTEEVVKETKKTTKPSTSKTTKPASTTKKPAATKPAETTKPTTEPKVATEPTYRIYHITKRTDVNMWQVKYAKGIKAIKLFKTQQEAIDFAKDLASRNGASIRLHGVNGKIRKI